MIRRIADSPTTGNLLWLVVCLLLAVGVWFIATNAGGNFEPRAFRCGQSFSKRATRLP